jgi:hypothetical protein
MSSAVSPFAHKKRATELSSSVVIPQAFWLQKRASEHARARLLPRLCCYLVIHIEKRLRILQLFYFHLWPIYWLTLVRYFETQYAFINKFPYAVADVRLFQVELLLTKL